MAKFVASESNIFFNHLNYENYEKEIFFVVGAMLLICSISFAQSSGGSLVELRPCNPPGMPPIGGLIPPKNLLF